VQHERTPPFTDREIRILRGMIDEHEYEQARRKFLGNITRGGLDAGKLIGATLASVLVILQILILVRGH
jgi:hypothetical protein